MEIQTCDDSGSGLRLTLNSTVAPGDYAFMVGVTNPAYTPAQNKFSLLLTDFSGNVIDAKMHFDGQLVVQGLYVRPPTLQFQSSEQQAQTKVQVTFPVSEVLDPHEAIGAVRAL